MSFNIFKKKVNPATIIDKDSFINAGYNLDDIDINALLTLGRSYQCNVVEAHGEDIVVYSKVYLPTRPMPMGKGLRPLVAINWLNFLIDHPSRPEFGEQLIILDPEHYIFDKSMGPYATLYGQDYYYNSNFSPIRENAGKVSDYFKGQDKTAVKI